MTSRHSVADSLSAAAAPLYNPASFAGAVAEDAPEPPTAAELDEFREKVAQWTQIDIQIKKLSVALRERRVHQRALSAQIQEFMRRFKYEDLNTKQGRIRHNIREVPVPIKLAEVRSKILDLAPEGVGEELIAKIFEDPERPKVEKQSLRRIVPKVSMHLDI